MPEIVKYLCVPIFLIALTIATRGIYAESGPVEELKREVQVLKDAYEKEKQKREALEKLVAEHERVINNQPKTEHGVGPEGSEPGLEGPLGEKLTQEERYELEKPPQIERRFEFKLKPGYAILSRQERADNFHSRQNTGGFATSSELNFAATPRLTLNATFDGIINTEHADDQFLGAGTILSATLNRPLNAESFFADIDDRVRLYTGSPNIKYEAYSSKRASMDFSLGYEFIGQQIRAKNPRFLGVDFDANIDLTDVEDIEDLSDVLIIEQGREALSVKENYFGHGPRMGLGAKFRPSERLGFTVEGFYTSFLDIRADTDVAKVENLSPLKGHLTSEGHAFRFDMGTSYQLRRNLQLGAGWRGYFLSIDQSKTRIDSSGGEIQGVFTMPEQFIRADHFYGYIGFSF